VLTHTVFEDIYYYAKKEALHWRKTEDLVTPDTRMRELCRHIIRDSEYPVMDADEFAWGLRHGNAAQFGPSIAEIERRLPRFSIQRSSHQTEAGGNGRFFSGFALDPMQVFDNIRSVLASSPDENMAVMIQPLVADEHRFTEGSHTNLFPVAAGCAYSTRFADSGEGKIVIVSGFGTKAVGASADHYVFGSDGMRQTETSLRPDILDIITYWGNNHAKFEATTFSKDHYAAERAAVLRKLPKILKRMEELNRGPVYVEFAYAGGAIWCLQIADTEPVANSRLDFSTTGTRLFQGKVVGGVARITTDTVVLIDHPGYASRLVRNLDPSLKNYLLITSSGSFCRVNQGRLYGDQIPNARAVVSLTSDSHQLDSIAGEHTRGALGRIPFLVTSNNADISLLPFQKVSDGVSVAKVRTVLEVNEAQGRGQLLMFREAPSQ
jgi:hypothetical protein